MSNPILDHWSFPYEPRNNQNLAFDFLYENRDKRYLVLEAPVGCGKSNIGITYSQFISGPNGSSYILTPQRILQEQYEQSFAGIEKIKLASLYGKGNYQCVGRKVTCDIGSEIKPKCAACPHALAREKAVQTANTVLNYKLALTSWAYTPTFSPRKLIIMDECHTLEQYLVDFDAVSVQYHRCNKYDLPFKKQRVMLDALVWIDDIYLPKLDELLASLRPQYEKVMDSNLTPNDVRFIKEFDALADHRNGLDALLCNEFVARDYVLVFDDHTIEFKRLHGAHAFERIIEPMAEQFIFMSSTILNKRGFCNDLGIDPAQTAFLSLPSDFPVENRPVIYNGVAKVNAAWKNTPLEQRKLLKSIHDILDVHEEQKGIIHTGNFQIAQYLVAQLDSAHKVFHHNPGSGDDRNKVINAFMKYPKASILISPSITEGLDLKDDLGRFAIFAKVPYGFLGDQWIKRRMELSNEWYRRQALINVIQGGGRVVRSPTDTGDVYILDNCFNHLFNQSRECIPQWWHDGFQKL